MKSSRQFISQILIFWLGLLFISPLFGIHIHHDINPSSKELSTTIHSYFALNHESSHQPDSSPPQPLYDHIAPYGISFDLGDWDSDLVYDAIFLFLLIPILITISFAFIISLIQSNLLNEIENPCLIFYKKSYRSFCLLNHLPPPTIV